MMLRYSLMPAPASESLAKGRSSAARRPSRMASSLRPSAASIIPSTQKTFSRTGSQSTGFHGGQSAVGCDGVVLAQGEIEPPVREFRCRGWVFGDDGLDGYVQRPRVRPPCE